ncbi:MAG: bifunctional UDP-N-acetylmuramoyl-tripeptide:D-alanyl-D-alanine ligase/alanine racemase [Bacteroides sp.]|nr:bifunctional UDP-N-acetylmuramoyl-tripeptide:D-alanyl-D-alanine ligase/alanine racemase [Roseburia sp.]MCM1346402.1 bifunctional UDP-N-acetylmuramoyl-tripeptide:D-alanyl-D-alanine ligase/alanine racemase [Bacteroides sp.]MCM1420955.1 bifunctional UDP-N-acetylmuramoyl-tripeptide:D-alanyl-D-alanine ligase/alanine racemase [Bacteroides sp.]
MQYKIDEIAHIIGGRRMGTAEAVINWLLIDSRSLCFPEETLFFALRTSRNDGHRYIKELYKRGVRNFVVSSLPEHEEDFENTNFLVVDDTLAALQQLAAHHRKQFDIPFIAITGSNGKTTVKEWLYQLLSPDFNVCRSPRSYNSQVGVPLSVWLVDKHTDIAIIETGISHMGEMERLQRIVRPTVGVITNIGMAHQENFLSLDIKCAEKLLITHGCRTAVVNIGDECIARGMAAIPRDVEQTTWSYKHSDIDSSLIIRSVEKEANRATVKFSIRGEIGQYTIPFIDDAAIENSITCLATCMCLNGLVDIDTVCSRMEKLEPVAMRLEVKDGANGCTLINDTYNSDIHSLDIALDFMNRRPDPKGQKRTLILSDILQSGEPPRSLYSRVAQMVESRGIEKIIGVGDEISACADYFHIEHHFFRTTEELVASEVFTRLQNEFILIKGARRFHFDMLCERLTLKVHQTILEVNLNALIGNVHYYRSFMRPETKMVCMVKASGYGVGALETGKTLQAHGVDYLAVAVADEGADMRKAGITANIMVMNPELTSFKMLFDYRLEPEVFNFQILEALIHAAEKEGVTNFPIHIKLDTGMHRLGFNTETDMPRLIERLSRQSALVPCSVFSHFVGSDSDEFDSFSRQQFALYDRASRQLQAAYSHRIIRHICNSAGIEHFPEYHLDMVRLGLGLYGINSRNNALINNVATLRTTILQIRDVPAADTVGYSRKGHLTRDSRIAAIPIGYADGLNRRLGNGNCYCLVNGKRAPYVGNICMDVCMIDVTDIDCKEGDHAIIFGDDLPVSVLSDAIGTIPYEILAGISSRVQRVYVQE